MNTREKILSQVTRALGVFLRIVQQVLSFLIILASLFLLIFLGVETKVVFVDTSTSEKYHMLLAELYLESEDWELIHYIENDLELSYLDIQLVVKYREKFWMNYKAAPDEYWHIGGNPFGDKSQDFYVILVNRNDYLLENTSVLARRDSLQQHLQEIDSTSSKLEEQLDFLKKLINSENGYGRRRAAFQGLSYTLDEYGSTKERNRGVYLFFPKYQLIVYDSFWRMSESFVNTSIIRIAREIFSDESEDLLLRLTAAEYLSLYDQEDFTRQVYVHFSTESTNRRHGIFDRELLKILRNVISDIEVEEEVGQ